MKAKEEARPKKRPRTSGGSGAANAQTTSNSANDLWRVRRTTGNKVASNRWFHKAVDTQENKVYFFGGRRRDKDRTIPDFYCFDVSRKKWTDLTKKLVFQRTQFEKKRKFPRLFEPAIAFARLPMGPFMFVFSGYDEDTKNIGNELIAIDLENFTWFCVKTTGQPGPARINAYMVYSTIQNSLFIFGGRGELQDDAEPMQIYSVVRFEQGESKWVISERVTPYLAGMGYDMRGISLFNGKKILLTPGRRHGLAYYNIPSDKILLFDTEAQRFSAQTVLEKAFPINKILNYEIHESTHRVSDELGLGDSLHTSIIFRCELKDEVAEELLATTDSILEIWRYLIFPVDDIKCLGLAVKIHNSLSTTGFYIHTSVIDYRLPEGRPLIFLGYMYNEDDSQLVTHSNAQSRTVTNALLKDNDDTEEGLDAEVLSVHGDDDCRGEPVPLQFWNLYAEIPV